MDNQKLIYIPDFIYFHAIFNLQLICLYASTALMIPVHVGVMYILPSGYICILTCRCNLYTNGNISYTIPLGTISITMGMSFMPTIVSCTCRHDVYTQGNDL